MPYSYLPPRRIADVYVDMVIGAAGASIFAISVAAFIAHSARISPRGHLCGVAIGVFLTGHFGFRIAL